MRNNVKAAHVLISTLDNISDVNEKNALIKAIEVLFLDAVDDWHRGVSRLPLREYLGLTEDEYTYWLLKDKNIKIIYGPEEMRYCECGHAYKEEDGYNNGNEIVCPHCYSPLWSDTSREDRIKTLLAEIDYYLKIYRPEVLNLYRDSDGDFMILERSNEDIKGLGETILNEDICDALALYGDDLIAELEKRKIRYNF